MHVFTAVLYTKNDILLLKLQLLTVQYQDFFLCYIEEVYEVGIMILLV